MKYLMGIVAIAMYAIAGLAFFDFFWFCNPTHYWG